MGTLEVAEPRCSWVETFLGVGNREEEMAGNGSPPVPAVLASELAKAMRASH